MAWTHTTSVLLASKSRDTDRFVLTAVTTFMRLDTHRAWPPVRYIAHGVGRSVRQTQKCLRRLENLGELVVQRRAGASHVYVLGPELLELAKRLSSGERGVWRKFCTTSDDAVRPTDERRGAHVVHPGDEDVVHTGGADEVHPNSSSTIKEAGEAKSSAAIHEAKRGKPPAREHAITPGWKPSAELAEWARQNRPELDLTSLVDDFRGHFMATGERRFSWDEAFKKWVKRERVTTSQPGAATAPTARPYMDAHETSRMLAARERETGPPSAAIRQKLRESSALGSRLTSTFNKEIE